MGVMKYLLEKELKQFVRDPFMPRLALVFPIVIMLVLPWIATMDITNVHLAVVDDDGSTYSQRLISQIEATDYFTLVSKPQTYSSAMDQIEDGSVDIILHIPADMEKSFVRGENVELFIAANAVNSTKGAMGSGYLNSIITDFSSSLSSGQSTGTLSIGYPSVSVQNRYNRYLNYRLFMVPAFLIMVMIAICAFLPTLNIVSEKEKGTIEQINVTPVTKMQFIMSKIIFYGLLGLVIFTIAFLVGKLVYGIAPYGGYGTLYLAAVLFIMFMAGCGLTISNFSNTLQQAVFTMFFFMMIFVLMSGLFTPVRSMVPWAYKFTYILAPRFFVEIMRAVCLKGSRIADLQFQFIMLACYTVIMDTIALITYRKRS